MLTLVPAQKEALHILGILLLDSSLESQTLSSRNSLHQSVWLLCSYQSIETVLQRSAMAVQLLVSVVVDKMTHHFLKCCSWFSRISSFFDFFASSSCYPECCCFFAPVTPGSFLPRIWLITACRLMTNNLVFSLGLAFKLYVQVVCG